MELESLELEKRIEVGVLLEFWVWRRVARAEQLENFGEQLGHVGEQLGDVGEQLGDFEEQPWGIGIM